MRRFEYLFFHLELNGLSIHEGDLIMVELGNLDKCVLDSVLKQQELDLMDDTLLKPLTPHRPLLLKNTVHATWTY